MLALECQNDGFSASGSLWFRFDGPLDVKQLPDPGESLLDSSVVGSAWVLRWDWACSSNLS